MVERKHPLAALAAASPDCPAVRLAAVPPVARLIMRGAVRGMTLPPPCRAIEHEGCAVLWLGPDELLLLAPNAVAPSVAADCVVDVSHRDTALTVAGPRAAWAINAFCALDLAQSAFPVGMCTCTLFGKSQIVLWRTATDGFRIEVARSFAPYVWACLEEARREFLA
jgi:heterotetrameric sarcosine oxidase gamma subunit